MSPEVSSRAYGTKARRRIAANVGLLVIVMSIVLVLVNVLAHEVASRFDSRFDVTAAAWNTLEPETKTLVRGIDENIEVYVVWGDDERTRTAARVSEDMDRVDPVILRDTYRPFVASLSRAVLSLLGEVKQVNPRIKIFAADEFSSLEATRTWSRKLGIAGSELVNNVIFRNPATENIRSVSLWKMYAVDIGGISMGRRTPPLVRGDFIEPAIVHGLKSVLVPAKNRVYLTIGRGEIDLEGTRQVLAAENYDIRTLNLDAAGKIPDDCDLLFIASPAEEWAESSRRALSDYVHRGGRVFLVMGRLCREPFERLLEEFGVAAHLAQLRHATNSVQSLGPGMLKGWDFLEPMKAGDRTSPITKKIIEDNHPLLMGFTRPFQLSDDFDKERCRRTVLAHGGTGAEVVPYLIERGDIRSRPDLVRRPDTTPFMLALEHHPSNTVLPEGRIIVSGSNDWMALEPLTAGYSLGNRDLFINSILWLNDREDLVTTTPRSFRGNIAPFTADTFKSFRIIVNWVLPGFVLLIGTLVWSLRQRSS